MLTIYITDKNLTDIPQSSSIIPLTINAANPGIITFENRVSAYNQAYLGGVSPVYTLEDVQVSPRTLAYTLAVEASFDGSTYDKIIADIVRTGGEGTFLSNIFISATTKPLISKYPIKLTFTTVSVPDIILYVYTPCREINE